MDGFSSGKGLLENFCSCGIEPLDSRSHGVKLVFSSIASQGQYT